MKQNNSAKDCVILRIPASAWSTLSETLEMDARSGAFDKSLRGEIQDALEKVETLIEPHDKVFVFQSGGAVVGITNYQGLELFDLDGIGVIDYDLIKSGSCPACPSDLEGHSGICPGCGLDTRNPTRRDTIRLFVAHQIKGAYPKRRNTPLKIIKKNSTRRLNGKRQTN